jgi:hypothetical protein
MICQSCGIEAPTRKVLFVRHIGAVVMFFHKRIGGELCRNCVNRYFREYTLTTLFLGWWGIISMFATPVVLLIDIANYLRAWSLPPVPAGATAPRLTDEAIARLRPMTQMLVQRMNSGESIEAVANDVAKRSVVTPGQVILYIRALLALSESNAQKPKA